jgi:uncharacterized protein YjbI with pentapeptide repeats
MSRIEVVKTKLIDPALETPDIHALEKASAVLRSVAEVEKIESDIAASTRAARSESLRFWIPILAPVVSALALIGTLLFQVQQYKESVRSQRAAEEKNAQAQRLANEDGQWREVLTLAKGTQGPEGAYALTLMQSFFDSDRYKRQAREVSVVLLSGIAEPNVFSDNFAALLERTDWDNFKHLKNISRAQLAYYYKYRKDSERLEDQQKRSKAELPVLYEDPSFLLNASGTNVVTASKGLVQFLRASLNSRPANIELDLNGCAIWEQDVSNMDFNGANLEMLDMYNSNLSGANLSGAKLYRAYIGYSNVKDADFSGVQASESNWGRTAWWRAKKISPDLLKHLQDKYKFSPEEEYRDDMTKDFSEYQKEVERLTKSSGGVESAATPQASPVPTHARNPRPSRSANVAPPREGNTNDLVKRTRSDNRNANTGNRNAVTPVHNANRRPAQKQQAKRTRRGV